MTNNFDAFVSVIKIYPKVQIKIKDMLDRYNRLPYIYQSNRGYDSSLQKVILEQLNILMGTTITDSDIELKMKISRKKYLENKKFKKFKWKNVIFVYLK